MSRNKHKSKQQGKAPELQESSLAGRLRQKPWFAVWAIFALIVVLAFFWSQSLADEYSGDKSLAAKSLYLYNQTIVDEYIASAEEELSGPYETTLDDDYAFSTKQDLNWLKRLEINIYESKPNSEVYAKEVAFTFMFERIISLNEDVAYATDMVDYSSTIQQAIDTPAPVFEDFNDLSEYFATEITAEEFDELLLGKDSEKKVFFTALTAIMVNYYAEKKLILLAEGSEERKYVESKKLIFLSYRATGSLE